MCLRRNWKRHSFKTQPGPRLGFRVLTWSPGLDRVAGSAGSIFFFLNQNDVVLVKKTKIKIKVNGFEVGSWSGLAGSRIDRVWPGQFPTGFWPPPGPVPCPGRPGPGRPAGPGRVLKLWLNLWFPLSFFHYLYLIP